MNSHRLSIQYNSKLYIKQKFINRKMDNTVLFFCNMWNIIWKFKKRKLWINIVTLIQFSSVQSLSCVQLCDPTDCSTSGFPVHHQLPEFAQTNPSSWWCHPTVSSSDIPFSSHLQSFPASGSFPMSQFFASGGQSIIEASTSVSLLPMNIQDWSPLGWTGWISLLSKRLSRVFSNTTVQKRQFFGTQLSLWSNSHIHTWLLEKP